MAATTDPSTGKRVYRRKAADPATTAATSTAPPPAASTESLPFMLTGTAALPTGQTWEADGYRHTVEALVYLLRGRNTHGKRIFEVETTANGASAKATAVEAALSELREGLDTILTVLEHNVKSGVLQDPKAKTTSGVTQNERQALGTAGTSNGEPTVEVVISDDDGREKALKAYLDPSTSEEDGNAILAAIQAYDTRKQENAEEVAKRRAARLAEVLGKEPAAPAGPRRLDFSTKAADPVAPAAKEEAGTPGSAATTNVNPNSFRNKVRGLFKVRPE